MKVLHFTLGKANPLSGNGINIVINGLCNHLNDISGFECEVLSISRKQKQKYKRIDRDNFVVHCFNKLSGVLSFVRSNASNYDIVHLHNAWTWENDLVSALLRIYKIPYIVSIHCALQFDRLENSNYIFKKIYHKLFQNHTFDGAALIHASTNQETIDIAKFTKTKTIVLPNGASLHKLAKPRKFEISDTEKLYGIYIGRLSKEKNVESLVLAIGMLERQFRNAIKIRIVGPHDKKFVEFIMNNNVQDCFELMGPLFGEDKISVLNESHFFVHPSLSDQIPTAWVEALSMGLPSLITRQSMVSYWYNSRAFIMMEPTPESIANGLMSLIQGKDKLDEMSRNAINLVEKELNWAVISKKFSKIYFDLVHN